MAFVSGFQNPDRNRKSSSLETLFDTVESIQFNTSTMELYEDLRRAFKMFILLCASEEKGF
jgi:hypothetical protein